MINDDVVSGTNLLKEKLEKDFINNSTISKISKNSKISITKLNTYSDTTVNGGSLVDSPRKYGNSFFHSSSSLQNSINSISFPKSTRFIANEIISPGFYKLPELSSKRAAAIGYGKKKVLVNDTTSPSPNAYTFKTIFEENQIKKKGSIFHPRIVVKNENDAFPGPQQYENNSPKVWLRRNPTSFKFRHGFFYDDTIKSFSSANAEMINTNDKKIGFNRRFEDIQIGLGYGNKIEAETKAVVANPGPGEYNIPSVFDKNKRYKIPLN